MALCKCKMCGGDLHITELDKVVECEYCGTTQTVPSADNEKKMTLFNRANRLRSNNEFDKAAALYEQLVAEFPEEAEAYWGLCLCSYGIEYVDDPATGKKIPTCHRASFEKLSADENFSLAMEYADVIAQRQYRAEAREIDRINEEILSVSRNETPYDIFICYKETDENGNRTVDSVMAQDIYDALIAKGYKVFFSRISLEDKLGQQYEPYIFAALNSAKIMLAIGTKYEYFHAVWVKNEWSRFFRLAAKDKSKTLIPCYKDMDPYDMPDEFKGLQAQDLGKLGAMQDLVRGVEKLLGKDSRNVTIANHSNAGALTKRGYIFLEDMDFLSADSCFERALDENPEDAKAYLGKVLCRLRIVSVDEMNNLLWDPDSFKDFTRAIRFSDGSQKDHLQRYYENAKKKYYISCFLSGIKKWTNKKQMEEIRIEEEKHRQEQEAEFRKAEEIRRKAEEEHCKLEEEKRRKAEEEQRKIDEENRRKTEEKRKASYLSACKMQTEAITIAEYEAVIKAFQNAEDYKDSAERIGTCQVAIREIKEQENQRKEEETKTVAEVAAKKRKRRIIRIVSITSIICLIVISAFLINKYVLFPNRSYQQAMVLMEKEDYEEALSIFESLNGYKDSQSKELEAKKGVWYNKGISYFENKDYSAAIDAFTKDGDFKNTKELLLEAKYQCVLDAIDKQEYDGLKLKTYLKELGDYKESASILAELYQYEDALSMLNSNESTKGVEYFSKAIEIIKKGKYIKFSNDLVTLINFYTPFLGRWEYAAGDARLLSYAKKNFNDFHSINEIEIKHTILVGETLYTGSTIQVYEKGEEMGMYAAAPKPDYQTGTIKQYNYINGSYVFSLKDPKTLLVDFNGKIVGVPEHATVEYKRVD